MYKELSQEDVEQLDCSPEVRQIVDALCDMLPGSSLMMRKDGGEAPLKAALEYAGRMNFSWREADGFIKATCIHHPRKTHIHKRILRILSDGWNTAGRIRLAIGRADTSQEQIDWAIDDLVAQGWVTKIASKQGRAAKYMLVDTAPEQPKTG